MVTSSGIIEDIQMGQFGSGCGWCGVVGCDGSGFVGINPGEDGVVIGCPSRESTWGIKLGTGDVVRMSGL